MSHVFAGTEWTDALWAELRSDEHVRSLGASWAHGPLVLLVEADSEAGLEQDAAIRFDLHEGEARDLRVVEDLTARTAPFVIAASYANWKGAIQQGGDLVDGVLRSAFHIKGDLPTLARHGDLLRTVVACAGRVPTSWPDEQPAADSEPAGTASART